MINRALISVSDKRGLIDFARELYRLGIEILSTGGTAKLLREANINVIDISQYTGFPEIMDGRVKTLHPLIHAGILARRGNPQDIETMKALGIKPIDMVVVNLYPFEATIKKKNVTLEEAIENIDIGGPTLLRAAAKNYKDVVVVVDPDDYPYIIEDIKKGTVSLEKRFALAKKVFSHTARYDALISEYFEKDNFSEFREDWTLPLKKVKTLRYGENPHQKAALYALNETPSLVDAEVLQGKEMSFNNYLDTHSAVVLAAEFSEPVCVIVKHNNPCGVAIGENIHVAYKKAFECDPVSAFGGIIAFNRVVDKLTALEVISVFYEVIVAPDFDEEALKVFATKKNLRLLRFPPLLSKIKPSGFDLKRILGGFIVQQWDNIDNELSQAKVVTKRQPTDDEWKALEFAWKVCKHVKSNAIVYAFKDKTVGLGIGQTSRVFSAKIAAMNALTSLKGSVVASDGFFPFRDNIDVLAQNGVTAIIQPGGSVRDQEVIDAANQYNMAMVFTGIRHFKH
ncbi:MAG: bifunctional phosphoribosylaminoimidazolecarboxamide formyltransferase/IMP cyclohydrolase [Thermodesulfovibrio sp.]|nr:bifunctional phosphoribosylaminoimidazolecarboxamide formyltransferase/IMP cyclohydrolase [Thermodesulfovibrio sp.]MCX7723853.1 bifunctional phosphoribosylaminoimidazolecarboxamide formyltransferase/IMP cyclohydrolase [Thermodesulfovibrio sp.]MDW7972530.1 bifunctional phosphoribosylaminoimidazolecarboxamide formyltransferase/IMP cyclohydrolase [Thermodesulfovibrio sp.]